MVTFKECVDVFSFLFFLTSPLTSYGDQILAMHRRKSSAGFSIDVSGIMLVASILRVFFWFGDRYELSLLCQSLLMIVVQCILLKMCLDYRPNHPLPQSKRPLQIWEWPSPKTYWEFLAALTSTLTVLQLLLGSSATYTTIIGFVALSIEATLPIPQFLSHYQNKSVAGFRPSVLVAWLLGDTFKCSYFFFGDANVTWQFKACALVQICFDIGIGVQFCLYRGRQPAWNANGNVLKQVEEELEEGVSRR